MACDCEFCMWYKKFNDVMKDIPKEHREFINSIVDNMLDMEYERDYYKAVVKNEWPDSDRILAKYRKSNDSEG